MKTNMKLIIISILSAFVMACATGPVKLPDKYNFDNKLEEAKEIYNYRIDSWESVDHQSLILRTNVNDYYLFVLQRPAPNLPFSEAIGLTVTIDKVMSGFDDVVVADSAGIESYIIEKIYKLKDKQQAGEIKKQIIEARS
jgi:hypothetical protein